MLALLFASVLIADATVSPAPAPTPPADAAVIVNSGSTNLSGYKIVVRQNGLATVITDGGASRDQQLKPATSAALFMDLAAATPLKNLETEPCMKSASFGSSTYIQYKGQRTPDVSCPMDGVGAKLGADVERITGELHVLPSSRVLRHTMSSPESPSTPSGTPPKSSPT